MDARPFPYSLLPTPCSLTMNTIKRICKFIASMRFAIILLVALALACSIGSLVTQGQSYDWYAQRYSERAAALILALRLDDAFHSAWFIAITAFLCLNLTLCNLTRLPRLIRRTRAEGRPEGALESAGDVSREGVIEADRRVRRHAEAPAWSARRAGLCRLFPCAEAVAARAWVE